MRIVWDIIVTVMVIPVITIVVVLRWATAFPRLGRWLDAKLYRVFPRVGHLLVDEPREEDKEGKV